MEEVNVHEGLKGVILYAKPEYDDGTRQDWLILVENVKRERHYMSSELCIYRHASYGLKDGFFLLW